MATETGRGDEKRSVQKKQEGEIEKFGVETQGGQMRYRGKVAKRER